MPTSKSIDVKNIQSVMVTFDSTNENAWAVLDYLHMLDMYLHFTDIKIFHYNSNNDKTQKKLKEKYNFLKSQIHREVNILFGQREYNVLHLLCETPPDIFVTYNTNKELLDKLTNNTVARRIKTDILLLPEGVAKQIKKVLVAVDFSVDSVDAMKRMILLNESFSIPIQITFLNITTIDIDNPIEEQAELMEIKKINRHRFISGLMKQLEIKSGSPQFNIEVLVKSKNDLHVGEIIAKYAYQNNYDLIVLGGRGHTASTDKLFGSVTHDVIQQSKNISVWSVKS